MNFFSRTDSTVYLFIYLINYPTGVSQVIFVLGNGVHRQIVRQTLKIFDKDSI